MRKRQLSTLIRNGSRKLCRNTLKIPYSLTETGNLTFDHNYRMLMYKEGVLRTTSEPYRPGDLSATTSHLTNHYLQEKLSKTYGLYEKGNEMFFDEFSAFLSQSHGISLEGDLMPQIKAIVCETLKCIKEDIMLPETASYRSFQLFGFDFMVDADFKVWLMEVNGSPAAAEKLLHEMAQNIVHSAIDPVFAPPEKAIQKTLFDLIN
eukprot:m.44910 g.44910  ORF g.44910 m.44910 type:complete len:206 (+) comp33551_c0_seq17:531-1148(+)